MSIVHSSSLAPSSSPEINAPSNFGRQCAYFHPSLWNDYFFKYASDSLEVDDEMKTNIETLKEEVRNMLDSMEKRPLMKAEAIDLIQCLGLSYHFELENDGILKQIHKDFVENNEITQIEDLHSVALLFKLLRQHGYHVSPDVFNKFKNEKGKFDETITSDVEGMITLYEACQMSIHGEEILDEALAFTSKYLHSTTIESNPFLAAKLNNVLDHCPYRGIHRVEARKFISIYHLHPSHNDVFLTLAKLDFNAVQKLHQKEIGNVCIWWNSLDTPRNYPFSRNRIVECCFWAVGILFEPQYSKGRILVAKEAALYTIIDDIYDAYGTLDELELLTSAIERWCISCLDDLPEYMKLFYKELLKFYDEEDGVGKVARPYRVDHFKKVSLQGYMEEVRWLHRNYTPTVEEYLNASLFTAGYTSMSMSSFIGIEDIVNEDIFKWAHSQPKILKASSAIARLLDDIVTTEFEQQRKHAPSSVQCYMKEHGVSKEEAVNELRKMIESAWKDMNEECLRPIKVPMPFLIRVLNNTRFMDVMYKEADTYTNSGGIMKDYITLLFVDPIPI